MLCRLYVLIEKSGFDHISDQMTRSTLLDVTLSDVKFKINRQEMAGKIIDFEAAIQNYLTTGMGYECSD